MRYIHLNFIFKVINNILNLKLNEQKYVIILQIDYIKHRFFINIKHHTYFCKCRVIKINKSKPY